MLILIAGDYKTGKTVSACTFPKPMLFLDFDDGFKSVMHAKGKDGNLVVPDYDQIEVIKFYEDFVPTSLDFNTADAADFKTSKAPDYTQSASRLVSKYNDVIKELASGKCEQYKTIVIDSLTSMFRLWKDALMWENKIPGLRIADYKTLEGVLFSQFIPTMKYFGSKMDFVILIDHVVLDKDEIMGKIIEFPVGPSQSQGRAMGKEFDEIWKQEVQGTEYVWRTKKTTFFQAGSRLDLPDPIKPATYQTLSKYLTTVHRVNTTTQNKLEEVKS